MFEIMHYHERDSEQEYRLVYSFEDEEVCSESGTSGTCFTLEEAYRVTEDGEVELPYNEETGEFEGLPSEPADDDESLFEAAAEYCRQDYYYD